MVRDNFERKYEDVVADYLAVSAERRTLDAEAAFEDVVDNRRTVENHSKLGLKSWPAGVSPNPGGRPRTKLLSAAIRRFLAMPDPNDPKNRTFAEQIALGLIREAVSGNVQAAKELREITEGKIPDKLEVGAPGELDIDHLWQDATPEELDAIIAEHLERTLARGTESGDERGSGSCGGDEFCEEGTPGSSLSHEEA
jgi:hypothetical protein